MVHTAGAGGAAGGGSRPCVGALPGSGASTDPYLITSATDLDSIRYFLPAEGLYFSLTADIDLSGYTNNWTPIGTDGNPFRGTLLGNGHTISGLTSNWTTSWPTCYYIGPFGATGNTAAVRDLCLTGVNITGHNYVGGLAGSNEGNIENCYVVGNVQGGFEIGGLVGYNDSGTISNSYAVGRVTGTENNFIGGPYLSWQTTNIDLAPPGWPDGYPAVVNFGYNGFDLRLETDENAAAWYVNTGARRRRAHRGPGKGRPRRRRQSPRSQSAGECEPHRRRRQYGRRQRA